ncbi:hypothetical protein D3273_25855 [Lichenibacterium minor]|uniref:Uncharacterized protein n=1 Tax=Lichenibacterium minor TaxID=2316528 RepID=A0A4Q2TY89_9HYPH|nr:hypothetical protein [Lichenibacterium minor]RYC29072.1 hypothetical protein D3273_25855 [Lichenibacterium minor]
MAMSLSADFDARRDAEMAVEHIVQEHGIDRGAVLIAPVSDENSAGAQVAGSDTEDGHGKAGATGSPALRGRLRVSVETDDEKSEKVLASFATYGGRRAN